MKKTKELTGRAAHAKLDHFINGLALPAHKIKALRKMADDVFFEARDDGIKMAGEIAAAYDHMSSHPYLPSDCIMMKLNAVPGKPRVNHAARKAARVREKIAKVIGTIERRVDSIQATTRFLLGVSQFQKAKARKR